MADYFAHPNRAGRFPPVVQALLIANGIGFLLLGLGDAFGFDRDSLIVNFALWPLDTPNFVDGPIGLQQVPQFQFWQLITYAFLHAGLLHLFFNMFALWMFGTAMEHVWGSRRFLVYFLVCIVGAAIAQLIVTSGTDTIHPTVGASGGVFGILLAFGMRFPNQYILLLIPPVPIQMVRPRLRCARALSRHLRDAGGGGALRPPGRHGRRVCANPLLAWQAALETSLPRAIGKVL